MPGSSQKPKFFYGWYIVAVGFLSHVACAFHMSSTLSVFLKPLTEDLAVSRGLFSLLRSGEILIGAAMAPVVGPLVDRYGGRWLMAGGALVAGAGFVLLSQVSSYWQFLALRWTLITIGGVFRCHMVVSVTVSRWFVRQRGRAIAIASLGQGFSKVCIPVVTATLFVWIGWRGTWSIFGIVTLVLIVIPALIIMRRSPEVGATVLSIIALTQLGSTLIWGFLSERMQIRYSSMLMFLVQATGLGLAIASSEVALLYVGFLLYGIGLSGGWVLQDLIWANYFGRLSLGMVRGLGILVTHALGAAGAPFFGYVHDVTGSYDSSFLAFVIALATSALLSLVVRAPRKSTIAARLTGGEGPA
jgi:MFS family permease